MSDHTQSSAKQSGKQSDLKSEELWYVIRRGDDLIVHLTYDVPFKFIFAQPGASEDLLTNFINEILELQGAERIAELTYLNAEVPPVMIAGRRLLLDLRVTDQRGVTYNVELQRENNASIFKRALFQQSRITGEQLTITQNFNKLTPVVVILICNYSIFPDYDAVRMAQYSMYRTRDAKGLTPIPSRVAHFDPETAPRYQSPPHSSSHRRSARRSWRSAELSYDLVFDLCELCLVKLIEIFKGSRSA